MTGRKAFVAGLALALALTAHLSAQFGGKPVVGGNPTPGTPQPEPPNVADRIALTGCVQPAPGITGSGAPTDPNEPSDTRFLLAGAERLNRVPADTGDSAGARAASDRTYRLDAIDSQLSPFVGRRVEISGEVTSAPTSADKPGGSASTLRVEFVQKIAGTCP